MISSFIGTTHTFYINTKYTSNCTIPSKSTSPPGKTCSLPKNVGDCVLYAGNVQILYFPDSNATNASVDVVTAESDGYTL